MPFWGAHQGGIVTPAQAHTYFAAFDLTTDKRDAVETLLRAWTAAAAWLSAGKPVDIPGAGDQAAEPDPADVRGLSPARLTLTFGFGAGLFVKDGRDRYGLRAHRPEAFVDLPNFPGDQLAPARTGGDLSVQACADDPQVAFHAIRQLARLAYGVAQIRWVQTGFVSDFGAEDHAAQSDGLQGRHRQSRRPTTRRRWTRWSGSATKGRRGCAAAATSSSGASASRSNIGTA